MRRQFLRVYLGMAGVLLLAAGTAHDPPEAIMVEDLGRIQTAVRYQIWHALALLGVGAFMLKGPSGLLLIAATGFALGSVLFCGGLYLLAFTGLDYFAWPVPVGGMAFVAGWLALAAYGWRRGRTIG